MNRERRRRQFLPNDDTVQAWQPHCPLGSRSAFGPHHCALLHSVCSIAPRLWSFARHCPGAGLSHPGRTELDELQIRSTQRAVQRRQVSPRTDSISNHTDPSADRSDQGASRLRQSLTEESCDQLVHFERDPIVLESTFCFEPAGLSSSS